MHVSVPSLYEPEHCIFCQVEFALLLMNVRLVFATIVQWLHWWRQWFWCFQLEGGSCDAIRENLFRTISIFYCSPEKTVCHFCTWKFKNFFIQVLCCVHLGDKISLYLGVKDSKCEYIFEKVCMSFTNKL